jgi:hypothetical protein
MNPYFLFTAFNILALICWLPLFISPYHKLTLKYVQYFYVPIFFAIVYGFCLTITIISHDIGSNSTMMDHVQKMFDTPWGFVTGWVHYLCFDFVVGSYMVMGAKKIEMKKLALVFCLLFTFFLGPMGFLIYRGLRVAKSRN